MKTPPAGKEHVTIAVSGAYGGKTVDFRKFAERGMVLLGMTGAYDNGTLSIADDLAKNIADGDENYLGLLAEADAYVEANGLDLPLEEDAKIIGADPECLTNPIRSINLAERGIKTVIWATGYVQDFSWLQADAFDDQASLITMRCCQSRWDLFSGSAVAVHAGVIIYLGCLGRCQISCQSYC